MAAFIVTFIDDLDLDVDGARGFFAVFYGGFNHGEMVDSWDKR